MIQKPEAHLQPVVGRIRTFEAQVDVSGFLEGDVKDWPANVQDKIYEKLEALSKKVRLPLKLVLSRCEVDEGGAMDGSEDQFFLRLIASEIVMADSKWVEEQEKMMHFLRESVYGGVK